MPALINADHRTAELSSGDVVQVARKMRDKNTDKPYIWKFFAVVQSDEWDQITCIPFGAVNERREDQLMVVDLEDNRNTVYYLAPEEWPDGVHANRLRMILTGLITII